MNFNGAGGSLQRTFYRHQRRSGGMTTTEAVFGRRAQLEYQWRSFAPTFKLYYPLTRQLLSLKLKIFIGGDRVQIPYARRIVAFHVEPERLSVFMLIRSFLSEDS